jgi:predicted metal-dependent HD superfamily phosphohydrolase
MAALYHDTGYTTGKADNHEYQSTVVAREELPSFGVHELDIEEICSLIMTTVPGYLPIDIVESVMVDADYGYLGMDYYPYVVELLRRERSVLHSVWRRQQIAFLENHTFFTASARKLFDRQKEINLKRLLRESKGI